MVRYKPIQGKSCGEGSALAAIWDMKKLVGVDGYIEVTIETVGDCTTATSFPFTYGTEPRNVRLRKTARAPQDPTPAPAPQRASAPAPAPEPPAPVASRAERQPPRQRPRASASTGRCAADCGSFSQLAGSSDLVRDLVRKECIERCVRGDTSYQSCVRNAYRSKDVSRCNDMPER
ncbi:MAG: hypothetical protein VX938_13040 [Myxococcota bacterium]|nr:hypothetical protein [Myxococcota bacterium]